MLFIYEGDNTVVLQSYYTPFKHAALSYKSVMAIKYGPSSYLQMLTVKVGETRGRERFRPWVGVKVKRLSAQIPR